MKSRSIFKYNWASSLDFYFENRTLVLVCAKTVNQYGAQIRAGINVVYCTRGTYGGLTGAPAGFCSLGTRSK